MFSQWSHQTYVYYGLIQERRVGGTLIERGCLGFRAGGAPLRLDLEDRESGFAERQEIPYRLIWSTCKTNVCRFFRIERIVTDLKLSFELRICQRGFHEDGLLLRIDLDLTKRTNSNRKKSTIISRGKSGRKSTEPVVPKTFRYTVNFFSTAFFIILRNYCDFVS